MLNGPLDAQRAVSKRVMAERDGRVLYVVRAILDPQAEAAWNDWHTKVHVPDVLKQAGFVKATKWRRIKGDKRSEYWTFYEIKDHRSFEVYDGSEAARILRDNHDARFGDSVRLERFVLARTAVIDRPRIGKSLLPTRRGRP